MSFDNVRLPTNIDYRSEMGPGYGSLLIPLDSKQDGVSAVKPVPRRKYTFVADNRTFDDLYELMTFFYCRRGSAKSFRLKDHKDFTTASDHIGTPNFNDVVIATGDSSETVFAMKKIYNPGTSYSADRIIRLPVAGTVRVGINGVEQTTGWSVNTVAGKIVFTSAPGAYDITIGCEFDVPVRFTKEAGEEFSWTFGEPTEDASGYIDGSISLDNLAMVETLHETDYPSDIYSDGGFYYGKTTTADIELWAEIPRVMVVEADHATNGVKMVFVTSYEPDDIEKGLWWHVLNVDDTLDLPFKNTAGTKMFDIPTKSGTEIWVFDDQLRCLTDWNPF